MPSAKLILDAAFTIAPVPRRLFGSFVEHMGRCVYTGIYEPGHPTADENGFRGDVLALTRELGVTRRPLPRRQLRLRLPLGGRRRTRSSSVRAGSTWPGTSIETNRSACTSSSAGPSKADVEMMMAVNLGTRGVAEACDLLEYTNHPGGTYWSDLRAMPTARRSRTTSSCGASATRWTAPGRSATRPPPSTAGSPTRPRKAMRLVDPDDRARRLRQLQLRGCRPSARGRRPCSSTPTTTVDYISLHAYYEEQDGDARSFLASRGRHGPASSTTSSPPPTRSGARPAQEADQPLLRRVERLVHPQVQWRRPQGEQREWVPNPPLIEDEYTVTDAVVVGTFLNSLLRHGDRVTVANQAQLVNVIGLLRSEEGGDAWKQTIAYPFEQMRRLAQGQIVQVVASGDKFDSATYTDVPFVDTSATYDAATGRAALFVANRSLDESSTLEVDLRGLGVTSVLDASTLHARTDQDRHTTNLERHDAITPQQFDDYVLDGGQLKVSLPALSWTVFSFAADRG